MRSWYITAATLFAAAPAAADPAFSMHVEAAAALPVGEEKSQQFGWGGIGRVAAEVALHEVVGLELSLGAVVLSDGPGDDPEGVAPTETGIAGLSTIGPRIRPLATVARKQGPFDLDGLWLAGGFGVAVTGESLRPAVATALGWDTLSDLFSAGPFVGLVQVVEPNAGSLRPEDARVAIFGVHGSLLPASRRRPPSDGTRDAVASPRAAPPDPPDIDQDGTIRVADACPDEPETVNGILDDDGCPDTEDLHVTGRFIVLEDRIHFDTDSSEVSVRSWPLVARLARFLLDHPEYAVIHIAGHADERGEGDYNLALSEARARSVRTLLVRNGVATERLVVDAYGETRPRRAGVDASALADNRRVELEIVERGTARDR